jgi:hypothetical protein
MPQSRPKITDQEVDKLADYFFDSVEKPPVVVFAVRGYYSKMGNTSENEFGIYDDAWLVYEKGNLVKTFNANTDPTKARKDLATLPPGVYTFYKGRHRNRIDAFRAYPEGVKWRCVRQNSKGQWLESWCSHINAHDGGRPDVKGFADTWSLGCQTSYQFVEFRDLVYKLMTKHNQKILTYVLMTENTMTGVLNGSISKQPATQPESIKPVSTPRTFTSTINPFVNSSSTLVASAPGFSNLGGLTGEDISKLLEGITEIREKGVKAVLEPAKDIALDKVNEAVSKVITGEKDNTDQVADRERPSWNTVINSAILQYGGKLVGGTAVYEAIMNPQNITTVGILAILAIALVGLGLWNYRRSAQEHTQVNITKLNNLADPAKNNTDLV